MSYIGNQPISSETGAVWTQQFSGDGIVTTFVLNNPPALVNNTFVYINGLYQQKTTYSLSGNNLTFTEAPLTGTANIEVVMTETLATGTIMVGTTSFLTENDIVVNQNYSITVGKNAVSAGPVTINSGVTVTIPTGSTWAIV